MSTLWRRKRQVLILLLFFSFASTSENQCLGQSILLEDRWVLEAFFKRLVTKEALGYVLLGEKPVVFFSFIPSLSWKHPIRSVLSLRSYFSEGNQVLKNGWKIWDKYSKYKSSKFLFLQIKSPSSPLVNFGFVVNRARFYQTISDNKICFEKGLNCKIDNPKFLENQSFFSELFLNHEELLGILLGYGKTNSHLFANREVTRLGYFPKKKHTTSAIALPSFRADLNSQETIQIQKRYLECRDKIEVLFPHPCFLDRVLEFLE